LLGDGIAETQLDYKKAEVEHGAGYCEADNGKSVEAIGSHAEESEEDAEFKSEDSTDVTTGGWLEGL
jgi:hypothetical protein